MKKLIGSLACTLALLSTFGCGADSLTGSSPKSAIAFKIDGATCAGAPAVTLDYFIDGSQVGTGTISPGQQSASYNVDAGSHVTLAKITNSGYAWGNVTMNVGSGQTMVRILGC